MSKDFRNSLTALLGVLRLFCIAYLVLEFLGAERVSRTASALAILNLCAIITRELIGERVDVRRPPITDLGLAVP
ncbi:MAG: hypothetical protein LH610_09460 [Sphingomonas bacterium]|nr:hypothetical protein [Sphingomonas bacterium]